MRRALFVIVALVACDPVHQDAVDALGGETQGVRTGPLHRAGQPCLVCHDGSLGSPPAFSIAGTVFRAPERELAAVGATVAIEDANGTRTTLTTNAAGNFYVTPNQYAPAFPLAVSVTFGGIETKMTSLVNISGACATCHAGVAGPTSVGHVYTSTDGGVP